MIRSDVLVVGAGAAGLAAAKDLSLAGLSVIVLDARERSGGRIATVRDPSWPLPIELGPEFIHGRPRATLGILEASGLLAVQLADVHWSRGRGGWKHEDIWRTTGAITALMRNAGKDRSVAEFLAAHPRISRRVRDLLLSFVEGYEAAPSDRLSEQSISTRGREPESHDQFRVINGYDRLTDWLAHSAGPGSVSLRLGTVVRTIRWARRSVEIEAAVTGELVRFGAAHALVTVPVGVWKAPAGTEGAIVFEPELPEKRRALERIEMGPVVKIVLRFREKFWDSASSGSREQTGPRLGFLQARGAAFPAWWSAAPVEAPILTAWAGGPAASVLAAIPEEELAARACATIASLLGLSVRRVSSLLEAWRTHDWQADPFSRGAYSYLAPGGVPARRVLARPAGGTLFFAGEGLHPDQSGTVVGAIGTGRRAARQLLRSRSEKRYGL